MEIQPTLETLSREACLQLLASKRVGRLGVIADDRPHVVPVNYALDGDTVVFRTGEATVLTEASLRFVALEIDEIDEQTHRGWSVVVHGFGREVGDAIDAESRRLVAIPIETWAGGDRNRVFKIEPEELTGRGIIPARP